MSINKSSNIATKMPTSMDYLYQAISLIETKGHPTHQFQPNLSPIGELASNFLGENKKRMLGRIKFFYA